MKDNKKKQFDKIIQSGTDIIEMPPYQMKQINGIVIKTFPFIRDSKLNGPPIHWDEEYPSKDYAILIARKNELENQINLNREYCAKISDSIRWGADQWLKNKFSLVDPDKLECQPLKDFALAVRAVIDGATHGVEIESIKNRMQKRNFKTTLVIGSVTLDAFSLLQSIETMIYKIEVVISRSVDLYIEYVKLHGVLYDFDANEFLEDQPDGYNPIPEPNSTSEKMKAAANEEERLRLRKWVILKTCEYMKQKSLSANKLFNTSDTNGDRWPKAELYKVVINRIGFLNNYKTIDDKTKSTVRGILKHQFKKGKFKKPDDTLNEIDL